MNTHSKNTNANGSGLKSHPDQLSSSQHGTVYDQITERIIGLLENGTVPWRKPWSAKGGIPRNLVSGKPYRGINVILLHSMSYESPQWLTYRQAMELGGNVRKGEKACPVVFWKQHEVEKDGTGEMEKIPLIRQYYVFNVAQCENLKNVPPPATAEFESTTKPHEVVTLMPNRPEIKHGMNKAFYSPGEDIVGMPYRERFTTEAEYFSTLYHELIHSTGSRKRLNRPTLAESSGFGSNQYCKEELIAEMGSAFLCGFAGIDGSTLENSAAYLNGWLEQLRNDKKLIVQAAAQAQKAADFVLGVKPGDVPKETNAMA